MPNIHEQATLTSKGQITLPKAIRQALGVTAGAKVAFELRDGEVVVTRADLAHEDPSIGAFLAVLEQDIRNARHLGDIPPDLAKAMLASLASGHEDRDCDPGEIEISGDVDI